MHDNCQRIASPERLGNNGAKLTGAYLARQLHSYDDQYRVFAADDLLGCPGAHASVEAKVHSCVTVQASKRRIVYEFRQ